MLLRQHFCHLICRIFDKIDRFLENHRPDISEQIFIPIPNLYNFLLRELVKLRELTASKLSVATLAKAVLAAKLEVCCL